MFRSFHRVILCLLNLIIKKKLDLRFVWIWSDLGSNSRRETTFDWLIRHSPFWKLQGIEKTE